jgi:hypothetical protein
METIQYLEILKNVSIELEKYPPIEKILETTRRIVLVFNDPHDLIYNFLVSKNGKTTSSRKLMVPNVLEAGNATFLFHQNWKHENHKKITAHNIYVRELISHPSMVIKVLSVNSLPLDLCKNCVGFFFCESRSSQSVCFANDPHDFRSRQSEEFFKFLSEQLKYQPIDLQALFKNQTSLNAGPSLIEDIYEQLKGKAEIFATKMCDYLAPEKSYKNNNMALQTETYMHLQITHRFRYDPFNDLVLLPSNLEEVFQHSNVSIHPIKNDWVEIKEIHNFLRNWKFFTKEKQVDDELKETLTIMNRNIDLANYVEYKDMLRNIDKQLVKFQAKQLTFKRVIFRKFEEIENELFETVVTYYVSELSEPLQKLNIWLDANMRIPEHQDKIPIFFKFLQNEFDVYFGNIFRFLRLYWFQNHQIRLPQDWQSSLNVLKWADHFFITAYYYSTGLELYLEKISEFSELIDLVDYVVRVPCTIFVFHLILPASEDCSRLEKLSISRQEPGNSSQFFEDLKILFPPESNVARNIIPLLVKKYEVTFKNAEIEYEIPSILNYIKRLMFFCNDMKKFKRILFPPSHLIGDIGGKIAKHANSLFMTFKKNFFERHAQKFIRIESSNIDSVVTHLNEILIRNFKIQFDNWQTSQPFKKLATLKYTLEQYDDFFKEIEVIFASMQLEIPEEDYMYLKNMQLQFDHLQSFADKFVIRNKISTTWDWGRGIRLSQDNYRNSAVSLSSPINFGFKTLTSAVKIPNGCAFNLNSLLLLASVVVLKIRKLIWNR